jgi:glycosyltransferase involved in cell wall biosynthesis
MTTHSSAGIPRVTVGMVVYNGERYLAGAIDSIVGQTFRDFELVISDNASSDGTRAICEAFAARDPRIRYVRQETNLGPARNFVFVLEQARGELFMWAAHDDLREPECLDELVAALDRNPRAVLASCAFDNLDSDGRTTSADNIDWAALFSGPKHLQFARLIRLDEIASQKANHIYGLMRRAVLRDAVAAVSFVDTYSGNDNCTLLDLLGRGEFEILPRVLFHYRLALPVPSRHDARASGPLGFVRYVWQRVAGRTRGHYGNLLIYIRRTNEYFGGLRVVVRRAAGLNSLDRLYLRALITVRQIMRPMRAIMASARHEL